jgi:hypothetical protein
MEGEVVVAVMVEADLRADRAVGPSRIHILIHIHTWRRKVALPRVSKCRLRSTQ